MPNKSQNYDRTTDKVAPVSTRATPRLRQKADWQAPEQYYDTANGNINKINTQHPAMNAESTRASLAVHGGTGKFRITIRRNRNFFKYPTLSSCIKASISLSITLQVTAWRRCDPDAGFIAASRMPDSATCSS